VTGPAAPNIHRWSRFVTLSKLVLPLAALGLLSTLFLFARGPNAPTEIPYAELEVIAQEQRISAPAFSGLAQDGSVFSVSADTIRPLPGTTNQFGITAFAAALTNPDGLVIDLTAAEGLLDGRAQTVVLEGLARITTSSGFAMETRGLRADLQAGIIETEGGLEVRAPFGSLTAGALRVEPGGRMLFSAGVRLLYQPQPTTGAP
jgi:lipopolysaccharide export system protein LptC